MKKNNINFLSLFILILALTNINQASDAPQAPTNALIPAKTIYIHGFTASPNDGRRYQQAFTYPDRDAQGPELPDMQPEQQYGVNSITAKVFDKKWKRRVNLSHAHFAAGPDITAVDKYVQEKNPSEPMVLMGCCRGAALCLTYVSACNPENVQALVMDGSSATMPAILNTQLTDLGIPTSWNNAAFRTIFRAYPKDAVSPVDGITNIKNKNLPVLIMHSKEDTVVSFTDALKLYTTFKKNGFNHVHLAVLKGPHAFLIRDDKEACLKAVHSFYKAYNLPHNPAYATEDNMEKYSYDLEQAEHEIETYQKYLEQKAKCARLSLAYKALNFANMLGFMAAAPQ